ncbi:rCG57131 [Rattus norvegicus]|uniref:RCG57131 n=1 Tax=Rattus norvegicus TaxID=10116 RepID=A6JD54_RAT|nr:rCG57131 [Rattus norvegicus]
MSEHFNNILKLGFPQCLKKKKEIIYLLTLLDSAAQLSDQCFC